MINYYLSHWQWKILRACFGAVPRIKIIVDLPILFLNWDNAPLSIQDFLLPLFLFFYLKWKERDFIKSPHPAKKLELHPSTFTR